MAFFNISSFFGNSSTNSFSSFNFADYASIRNGSYGRLLKAYYSQAKQTTTTKSDTDKTADKTTDTDNTGLSKMKKEADGLKEAADKLTDEDAARCLARIFSQTFAKGDYEWKKVFALY